MAERKTILVIEDHPGFAASLVTALSKQGYSVLMAFTGKNGIKLCREHQPDLVVLDLILPNEDGFQVLKDIKPSGNPTDYPPVIVVTNVDTSEAVGRALCLGATKYITKHSHELSDIVGKVNEVLCPRSSPRCE